MNVGAESPGLHRSGVVPAESMATTGAPVSVVLSDVLPQHPTAPMVDSGTMKHAALEPIETLVAFRTGPAESRGHMVAGTTRSFGGGLVEIRGNL